MYLAGGKSQAAEMSLTSFIILMWNASFLIDPIYCNRLLVFFHSWAFYVGSQMGVFLHSLIYSSCLSHMTSVLLKCERMYLQFFLQDSWAFSVLMGCFYTLFLLI